MKKLFALFALVFALVIVGCSEEKEDEFYTVVFYANDGTSSLITQTLTIDKEQKLKENTFIRDSFYFFRWNTAADGSGTSYLNGATVKNLTMTADSTVMLYAQWITDEPIFMTNEDYSKKIEGITNSIGNSYRIYFTGTFTQDVFDALSQCMYENYSSKFQLYLEDSVLDPNNYSKFTFGILPCLNLTYLSLPVEKNGNARFAFNSPGCAGLETVVLSDEMTTCPSFSGLKRLKSVSLPKTLITFPLGTFSGCSSLKSLTIPEGVREIPGSFCNGCVALEEVVIPEGVLRIEGGGI